MGLTAKRKKKGKWDLKNVHKEAKCKNRCLWMKKGKRYCEC